MARQIEMLIEDQDLRKQEIESFRRQLEASTTSAREAQLILRANIERTRHSSILSAALVSTPNYNLN